MAPRFEETRVPPPQHSEEQLRVMRCLHEVWIHRSQWPPREKRGNESTPHVDVNCKTCGALVQVEAPPQRRVRVHLYGSAEEAQGQIVEEHEGQVIEEPHAEPQEPVGGTVTIEERERPRGRRSA